MSFFKSAGQFIRSYAEVIIVSAIILSGFLLRLIHLDSNDLALHEPFSVFHAQQSVGDIIASLKGLNNPPLNEIILHFWIRIFGLSVYSVRFPALIFGTLNLLMIYLLARKMLNVRVAMLALILVTISNYQLFFSHEARIYALFALLTTCSFYIFIRIIRQEAKLMDYILLFLSYALLLYSHYFGAVVMLMQISILFLLVGIPKKERLRYLICLGTVLLIYSFYVPEIFARFMESSQEGTWLLPVENLGQLHDLIYLFANSGKIAYFMVIALLWAGACLFFYRENMKPYLKWSLLLYLVLCFLISYSIFFGIPFIWKLSSKLYIIWFFALSILALYALYFFLNRKKNHEQMILLGWFLIPLMVFYLVSFKIPIFLDRYLVFIMPAFYILLAMLIGYLVPKKYFWVGAALLVLGMLISFHPDESNKREVKKLVEDTRVLREGHAKVFICPEQFKHTFCFHYDEEIFRDHANLEKRLVKEEVFFVYDSTQLNEILDPKDSIILYVDARGQFLFPNNGIVERLSREFGPGNVYMYEDSLFLYKFRRW